MLGVAEMYINGVSTRRVEDSLKQFGIVQTSSTQASRATALLDDALQASRERSHWVGWPT